MEESKQGFFLFMSMKQIENYLKRNRHLVIQAHALKNMSQ